MTNNNAIISFLQNMKRSGVNDIDSVINKLRDEDNQRINAEEERLNKCKEWYKNLVGKYVKIVHNQRFTMVLYVNHEPKNEYDNLYDTYSIDWENKNVSFENRKVNRYWFANPYEKEYYGKSENVKNYSEITKEEYDNIIDVYNQTIKIFNDNLHK